MQRRLKGTKYLSKNRPSVVKLISKPIVSFCMYWGYWYFNRLVLMHKIYACEQGMPLAKLLLSGHPCSVGVARPNIARVLIIKVTLEMYTSRYYTVTISDDLKRSRNDIWVTSYTARARYLDKFGWQYVIYSKSQVFR